MSFKAECINEPCLEFGGKRREIDIRLGLRRHGPLDKNVKTGPRLIKTAIIGTDETIAGLSAWLERCKGEIPAKKNCRQPNLFPAFPGFRDCFSSELVLAPQLQRTISSRTLQQLLTTAAPASNDLISQAVQLFVEEMKQLDQPSPDVVLCALPFNLLAAMEQAQARDETNDDLDSNDGECEANVSGQTRFDFHDLLKSEAIKMRIPIQLILPSTYDESQQRPNRIKITTHRRTQDEATRAWNLHTALYYKAGGTPWRLVREAADYSTCFVGISFYRSLSQDRIDTSVAQVFNELGEGIIVRGGAAKFSKKDRQVHLSAVEAERLLLRALQRYRSTHKASPARLVLYKTSPFNDDELDGFKSAISSERIEMSDLLNIRHSKIRLFRNGAYPPLRGTCFYPSLNSFVLYTKGSVPFFATYPGMYIPQAIECDCRHAERSPQSIARELLALTKMNWNNTQFDAGEPICTLAARKVGKILKYVDDDSEVEYRYSYYM